MIVEGLLLYISKFFVSVSALYLFYRFILRPLTFYQWNRFFLLTSITGSFIFPLVNTNFLFSGSPGAAPLLLTTVPSVSSISFDMPVNKYELNIPVIIISIMFAGSFILLCRLIIQVISLAAIKRNSVLVHRQPGLRIYEPYKKIAPFSFGKCIYINRSMYSDDEIKQIIEHEAVHIAQRHTGDLILSEILCLFNWYNPFAWHMRRAIRQNLEFIADDIVLKKGFDPKEYQYTLIRSASSSPLPLTNTFSMPNLKKRIIMMNKIKTSAPQLVKFVAVFPVLVFISLLFRDNSPVAQVPDSPVSIESGSGVVIKGDFKDKPLFIVDGLLQPPVFDIKYIKPEDIRKVQVWKGEEAINRFGKKAVNGAVDVETTLPLYVIDGDIQMKTSNLDHLVKEENIKSRNVLSSDQAVKKYGRLGSNQVIEIVTK